jgi:archaellum component FlaC
MTIEISVMIAVLGFALSAGTFFVGRMTAARSDGITDGELKSDIKHIKATVDKQDRKLDDVAANYSELKDESAELKERLHVLEERVQMLHGGEA